MSLHPTAVFFIHLPPLCHEDGAEPCTQPGVSPALQRGQDMLPHLPWGTAPPEPVLNQWATPHGLALPAPPALLGTASPCPEPNQPSKP